LLREEKYSSNFENYNATLYEMLISGVVYFASGRSYISHFTIGFTFIMTEYVDIKLE
jgi:hypothetical protein